MVFIGMMNEISNQRTIVNKLFVALMPYISYNI